MTQVADLYRSAANRFLQSALIVDDRAALVPEDDEVVPEEIEDPRPRPTEVDAEAAADEASVAAELEAKAVDQGIAPENRLAAQMLIDRFAALGMVCGVLRPGSDAEATQALALKAAERADIVVLDWHLNDSGTRALALLSELSDPESKRLRLVCVYTGDGHGQVVADIASLTGIEQLDDFLYQRGSTRIVLLYKEGGDRTGAPVERVVKTSDLPERLLDEFANLCAGLVSAAAMSALGAVRGAMPEILGVLVPELDPAFVGQRLAQERPDDARDHVAELVVSEIQSIVEDDGEFAASVDTAAVEAWLDHRDEEELTVERDALKEMNRRGGGKEVRAEIGEDFPKFKNTKKSAHPTTFVVKDPEAAELADARLAERMTTRHRYPGARRERLELGVIVEAPDGTGWRVCVLPLCDSVRLEGKSAMPFLPLVSVEKGKPFDLVVERGADLLRLHLKVSPAAISLVDFVPDDQEKAILTVESATEEAAFVDSEGRSWKLLCRLKQAHAQRIAHRLGTEFSRIGLNESEWLRETGRKGN